MSEFAPGGTTPTANFTGLSNPTFPIFDSSGDLFVSNFGPNGSGNTVSEFARGGATITTTTPTAGGVTIQSSVESRLMLIGGTNSNPVAGINLTSAELAQIETTATGTITIGDSNQTGNITLSTATPVTTAGAAIDVLQSTAGAGQIILDDGAGTATALNGNGGNVILTAGTGGIVALAANGSTAEIATTGAAVTLSTTGPIGTSTNRIQFADDSNTAQQVVSIGSAYVQPSSVYLDGLGSLTLGSIIGGAVNATIDVTARTNLVVATGANINSGLSTLSLGADLTAAEAGDNGVGTLSINAGATVTSSNSSASAITLRGADINIDTSSNPAFVGAEHLLNSVSTGIGGVSEPEYLAVDSSNNLYVGNIGDLVFNPNTVVKFRPGPASPLPFSLAWTYPAGWPSIQMATYSWPTAAMARLANFAPGGTTPIATLTGLSSPFGVAFDASGNLYVANSRSGHREQVCAGRHHTYRNAPRTKWSFFVGG